MYSLAQAAKAAGKSKPTIMRAIKAGKVSAARRDDGSYQIDPAELHRVYPVPGDAGGMMKQSVPPDGAGMYPATSSEIEGLRALLAERDARIAVHERANEDLRRRLDAEAEERRRLTAILADQRAAPRRSWWPGR